MNKRKEAQEAYNKAIEEKENNERTNTSVSNP